MHRKAQTGRYASKGTNRAPARPGGGSGLHRRRIGRSVCAVPAVDRKSPSKPKRLEVRDRGLRLEDPKLRRAVVDMEVSASLPELWLALRQFLTAGIPNHHSATL